MNKSVAIRDAFALASTDFRFKERDLNDFVAVQRLGMLPALKKTDVSHWNKQAFLALARIKANQRALETDLEHATRMFSFAEAMFGKSSLKQNDQLIYLEALGELGNYEKQLAHARRFGIDVKMPTQFALLQLNSIQATLSAAADEWVETLNRLYGGQSFSQIEISHDANLKPLDRLRGKANVAEAGPKVTVIVPSFQGGPLLMTALRSLINQTWENLEIIVVDDGSGPEYETYLSQAIALSSKIQIIRQPENLGAYAARNAGVEAATGSYVTVHDDDDWSHPEKISLQVRHLLNNPQVPGNLSTHTRATDDLRFLRINNNPILAQANYSSLMVHRSVFTQIGLWDPVNRGADSEFRARIKRFYGKPVQTLGTVPLSFTRTRDGSLTAGELSRGFLDPARVLYSKAYQQWHEAVGDEVTLLKPSSPRKYPVPSTMEIGKRNAELGKFDVVFMTDFRFPGGTSSLTLQEIQAAAEAGYRVGYIQMNSPLNASNTPISPKLFELQLHGYVEQVGLQDVARIELLVVRHPSVATYMDGQETNLEVKQTLLIVNNPPVLRDGQGMVFDLSLSVENLDKVFSLQSYVIAESRVTQRLCRGLVAESRLLDRTWPGLVGSYTSSLPSFAEKPTVGRHSRDHSLKWPSSIQEFNWAYTSSEFHTKFLGGADALVKKLGSDALAEKTVYSFGEIPVEEFLSSVDFWVYFHDSTLTESFGMSIAEAMAAGKVVILPHYLEANFGEGAIYAEPSEVESLVREFWTSPDAYKKQASKAQRYASENFSVSALLRRLEVLRRELLATNQQ
ncbi:glycosyltransferase [Enteractinococcus coprophilus]|nr:glycosyltransferase [Enteractinococcus coprophilus]